MPPAREAREQIAPSFRFLRVGSRIHEVICRRKVAMITYLPHELRSGFFGAVLRKAVCLGKECQEMGTGQCSKFLFRTSDLR